MCRLKNMRKQNSLLVKTMRPKQKVCVPIRVILCFRELLAFVCWVFFHAFVVKLNILKNYFMNAISECLMVWIQIRTDILLVLNWVQTVCKGHQQTKKVSSSKERIKAAFKNVAFFSTQGQDN